MAHTAQGDLTPNFPTFAKPILNLELYMNADPDDLLHRPYLLLNKEDDKGLGRWGVRVSKIADFETT